MDKGSNDKSALSSVEQLAARWDKVSFRVQGSPFEDLSINCLAKNVGTKAWSRAGTSSKGDVVARYIYLSFEELLEVEKLDLKAAKQLLEICEATFLMEQEYYDLGSFDEIDKQAYGQRLRFVEEFGLYQDFPVSLSNLDADLRELCQAEEVITFIDLMEFLDRLADKAWTGGSYRNLQNVFAHGDEHGLSKYFPYRLGHRGFHLPEAMSFILNRLSKKELNDVLEYHERRRKRKRLGGKRMELPSAVETVLLPDIFKCMQYFGRRQPRLLIRMHDSAYLCRELMFLNDPQTEGVLHWLIHLALGIFRPKHFAGAAELNEEIESISLPKDDALVEDLRRLLEDEATA